MPTRIARLGDEKAPFRFKKGEQVTWRRSDGSLDAEFSGLIVDGVCEYEEGGGSYKDRYIVERKDGVRFPAGHFDIVKTP